MKELEIDYFDPLKCVLITHMHGDHIGGLEQLIYERYYLSPEPTKTYIYTHPDLAADLNLWLVLTVLPFTDRTTGQNSNNAEDIFQVLPWEPETCALGTCEVEFLRVPHCGPKKCYGILFDDPTEEVSIYWSGDSELPSEEFMADVFDRVDIIFHDCSFAPSYEGTVHTHYTDLTHFSPLIKNRMVLIHGGKVPEGIDPVADGFIDAAHRGNESNLLFVPDEDD